jgi:hypothetical protein
MPDPGRGRNSDRRAAVDAGRRKPRRRTILNLGIPFVPVDDALNQAEDALATGFDVLQKVVEEIQEGYRIAKEYNASQRKAEQAGEARPALPWIDIVKRGRELQSVAVEAMKKGNDILLDSTRSGMNAALAFAETLANARTDVDESLPRLAGPVFDSLSMEVAPGQLAARDSWRMPNRGLARLRIHVKPAMLHYRGEIGVTPLEVEEVRFEPEGDDPEVSILTVVIKPVPRDQPPGSYEGSLIASNFDLFIGQLVVRVTAATEAGSARPSQRRKGHASRRARG